MTNPAPATVADWLLATSPRLPAALSKRLEAALSVHMARTIDEVPEACLEAGEQMLQQLLSTGSTSRDSALELLTVDALVTYAFEAAANNPDRLDQRAERAMQRIAGFRAQVSAPHSG